jgi:RHS repeat-associated protein
LTALSIPSVAGIVLAEIEYFYSDDGTLTGKAFNGKRVNFEYDLRGQLLAVKDAQGKDLERYTYDRAGNRLSKTINGLTTTYTYDKANQLVTSTVNGVTTHYKYDAAGRMIQAGDKTYIYNGRNKVVEVRQNGTTIAKFEYNIDGQISKAIYGDKVEEFIWDGLALIWRSGVTYINEPYITGGNPVMAGDDVLFNDMLGSTLAVNGKAVEMTSFGETADKNTFFTGKPMIDELGYSFLFRDYNPNQGKWTTTDPLGYPDGWNNLAYCNNGVTDVIDFIGAVIKQGTNTGTAAYRNFINNVINVASQSNTMLGQAIRNSNATVNFVQNNNRWPNVDKGFLGLQTPTITMDIYDYKMDNVIRNPIFTLLHELAHIVANGTEASINQKVEQLLADGAIQSQLKQIMSTYPAKGEIIGTLRADQTYTVGYRREYGE